MKVNLKVNLKVSKLNNNNNCYINAKKTNENKVIPSIEKIDGTNKRIKINIRRVELK